jgi:hypothetical protein
MSLPMNNRIILLLVLLAIFSFSPAPIHAWELVGESLQTARFSSEEASIAPPRQADFDGDGKMETLELRDGQASIVTNGQLRWQSPAGWEIRQAGLGDLNHDGAIEAVLLVWRPFRPWPVDEWLPNGGRIANFHNASGESCQIIMIGWSRGSFRERWAGSALAEPVSAFSLVDLNQDRKEELVTLDTTYAAGKDDPADMLKVWEWNGFGFSLVSSVQGAFSEIQAVRADDGHILLLTQ